METLYSCKKKHKVDSEKEEDLLKVVFLSERLKKPSRKEKDRSEKQQPWKGRPWTVFIVTEFCYVVAAKLSFWYRSVFNITSEEKKESLAKKEKFMKYRTSRTLQFALM